MPPQSCRVVRVRVINPGRTYLPRSIRLSTSGCLTLAAAARCHRVSNDMTKNKRLFSMMLVFGDRPSDAVSITTKRAKDKTCDSRCHFRPASILSLSEEAVNKIGARQGAVRYVHLHSFTHARHKRKERQANARTAVRPRQLQRDLSRRKTLARNTETH